MRLIDLHCDWLQQYATECTLFDPALYAEMPQRLGRLAGYLQGTSLAVLACTRKPEDWDRQGDRWASLAAMLAVYEAEFAGRLLIAPHDVARWRAEPADALCWGTLGVTNLASLVREPADLDRLPGLFERGVRVFQIGEFTSTALAGTKTLGDDRGLTDLGRALLARLGELSTARAPGPTPILDLAGMNPRSIDDVLEWYERPCAHDGCLLLTFSHGGVQHQGSGVRPTLNRDHLVRFRAIGGVVGVTSSVSCYQTIDELKAAIDEIASIPFEGRVGYEGIAIGTDFLACEQFFPGLAHVDDIKSWIRRVFDREPANLLVAGNASRLLVRAAGLQPLAEPKS